MKVREERARVLRYLALEPDTLAAGQETPLVFLLHGFGAHMGDLATLAPALGEGYIYICPNAPLPVEVGFGSVGYAWTPIGPSRTPEDVERAVEALEDLRQTVGRRYGSTEGRAVVVGFSQGGMMAYAWGLRRPQVFRGVAALSAMLPDLSALARDHRLDRRQALFVAHGSHDQLIPVQAGRQAVQALQELGYNPRYHEYPMGHEIAPEVLRDLASWLWGTLPPATDAARRRGEG